MKIAPRCGERQALVNIIASFEMRPSPKILPCSSQVYPKIHWSCTDLVMVVSDWLAKPATFSCTRRGVCKSKCLKAQINMSMAFWDSSPSLRPRFEYDWICNTHTSAAICERSANATPALSFVHAIYTLQSDCAHTEKTKQYWTCTLYRISFLEEIKDFWIRQIWPWSRALFEMVATIGGLPETRFIYDLQPFVKLLLGLTFHFWSCGQRYW